MQLVIHFYNLYFQYLFVERSMFPVAYNQKTRLQGVYTAIAFMSREKFTPSFNYLLIQTTYTKIRDL